MKKIILIMLCTASISLFAATPLTEAALQALANPSKLPSISARIGVDITKIAQTMNQLQNLNLGNKTIATILQEGGQIALKKLANGIDTGRITPRSTASDIGLVVGVAKTKIEQTMNQDQKIRTKQGWDAASAIEGVTVFGMP